MLPISFLLMEITCTITESLPNSFSRIRVPKTSKWIKSPWCSMTAQLRSIAQRRSPFQPHLFRLGTTSPSTLQRAWQPVISLVNSLAFRVMCTSALFKRYRLDEALTLSRVDGHHQQRGWWVTDAESHYSYIPKQDDACRSQRAASWPAGSPGRRPAGERGRPSARPTSSGCTSARGATSSIARCSSASRPSRAPSTSSTMTGGSGRRCAATSTGRACRRP